MAVPPGPTRPAYNVPMALDLSLTHTRGLEPKRAKPRNRKLVQDSRSWTLGPIPVHEFLNDFLPSSDTTSRRSKKSSWKAFRAVPLRATAPAEIYEPLIAALNAKTKHKSRAPNLVFCNASTNTQFPRKLAHMKPHICCYAAENIEAVGNAPPAGRVELGFAELFIEVKEDPSHDFFTSDATKAMSPTSDSDDSHDESDSETGRKRHMPEDLLAASSSLEYTKHRNRAFGQHIAYVTEIFARQHRVFLFSISLSGSYARFLRWDRAGCIVSEPFDIREEPEPLCEFIWRFSQMTASARGHDATVRAALPAEEALFQDKIRSCVRAQLGLDGEELDRAVREHYEPNHVSVVYILPQGASGAPDNLRPLLVSRPVVSPLYLTGRATRGFWAVDLETGRVVFLKDTWRSSRRHDPSEGPETEGEILLHLAARDVRNVPSLLHHGDVPGYLPQTEHVFAEHEYQTSVTNDYILAAWVRPVRGARLILGRRWHYRVILGTVGYGLQHLRGTRELLHATHDVLGAMSDALTKASRLHRDISVGNIVLVREDDQDIRRGYLIDWDASIVIDQPYEAAEPGRAGTWLFMSGKMLCPSSELRKQTFIDDMESLLYVLLYCSFLWLPHNLSKEELKNTINQFFEQIKADEYGSWGGNGKFDNAKRRTYTASVNWNPALKEFLDEMMNFCNPPYDARDRYAGIWTDPNRVDTFWTDFLQKHAHSLPSDDRFVHDHPYANGNYDVSVTAPGWITTEMIMLRKRSPDSDDPDDPPPAPKRRRVAVATTGPRRSSRIQKQAERRGQAVPTQRAPRYR